MTRLHEFTPLLKGGCGSTPTPSSRLVVILSLTTIVSTRSWLLGVLDILYFHFLLYFVYLFCDLCVFGVLFSVC